MRHDQRPYLTDALDRGVAPSADLTCDLPDEVAVAAQREHDLVPVLGGGQDFDPSGQQDEHVRGRIVLKADDRVRLIMLGQAETSQGLLFTSRKQSPEF